ncbi:hypothetical protein MPCS_00309 [Candidatus Megaera polyxenophila]|jgi:hypothetical protein|nr:hypothetical protein MPCS_00309 [Candidatus Megaera polyxenophila]
MVNMPMIRENNRFVGYFRRREIIRMQLIKGLYLTWFNLIINLWYMLQVKISCIGSYSE